MSGAPTLFAYHKGMQGLVMPGPPAPGNKATAIVMPTKVIRACGWHAPDAALRAALPRFDVPQLARATGTLDGMKRELDVLARTRRHGC